MPDTSADNREIQLLMDRRMAEIPKGAGSWLRQLVRTALVEGDKIETTWNLSRDLVVVELDCGIQTSVEIPCTSESWTLDQNRVCLAVDPLATAAILECFEHDARGSHLAYRDGSLAVQASSRSYRLAVAASLR